MKKKNILYMNHVSQLGGGEHSLIYLISMLDKSKYQPILLLQDEGPLSDAIKKLGVKVCFIQMPGWRKFKKVFSNHFLTLPKLTRIVQELNIDLIHCNAYRLNPYSVLVSKSKRIPCLTHVRWFTDRSRIKKFKLDKTDLVITVSNYMASFFKKSSCNVKTIYDGIDLERFRYTQNSRLKIRKEFGIEEDDSLIAMVAQLTPRKGHKDFIKAAALLEKKLPKVKFAIVGGPIIDSSLSIKNLKDYAQGIGVKNLTFFGQREDVSDLFSVVDCFVLPSHVEPLGLVILEAMATRVPVVATCSGGPEEIICSGEDGLLVPIKNPNAIAEAVEKILCDRDFKLQIIEKAYKKVKDRFNIQNCVKRIESIYDQLLSS